LKYKTFKKTERTDNGSMVETAKNRGHWVGCGVYTNLALWFYGLGEGIAGPKTSQKGPILPFKKNGVISKRETVGGGGKKNKKKKFYKRVSPSCRKQPGKKRKRTLREKYPLLTKRTTKSTASVMNIVLMKNKVKKNLLRKGEK